MNMMDAEERYRKDPQFAQLVRLMIHHVQSLDYTPSELRDAAMLASLYVEQTKPIRITMEAERLGRAFPHLKLPDGA